MKFIKLFSTSALILSLGLFFSCEKSVSIDITDAPLIPLPGSIEATFGSFELSPTTTINLISDSDLQNSVSLLKESLEPATGYILGTKSVNSPAAGINLIVDTTSQINSEGYELEILKNRVEIKSVDEKGLFYGIQTLIQLFPPEIASSDKMGETWLVGTGVIKDSPDFGHRGAMLDVARHFFSVADVKKFIDHISNYKINVLHLHLSDDQGWRIEIKSWPNLTKIGGQTQVGGGQGGFFTQEEYKDLVAYAASKFITVIPEIDMPGHTNAALASYAELNCNNKATELYTGIEVGFSTLCTSKEIVYQFADDVIRELSEMTPGEYIHIGGDETHATSQEDYIPFMSRVQEITIKYGKKNMAWDEVAHSDMKPGTVAQFWDNAENAKKAISKGGKILVSPAKKAYLDMQYDSTSKLGLHWAAYIEADDAYNWDPSTYAEGITKDDIIGVEAPLWSETIEKMDDIEYMIFPRITAIAEIGWTSSEKRDWEGYSSRLSEHSSMWDIKGINYYRSNRVDWPAKTELNPVE